MPAFTSPVDIGQRALQHCGAQRMDPILGFNDTSSRGASEVSSVYDKVREAELQRNIWTFATKRVVLRAITTGAASNNTMLMQPALWSPSNSYYRGSVVADQSNNLWISRVQNNINNDPLLTTLWEPYFGPLAVAAWDTTGQTSYFAGEVVYTDPGDGSYKVYLSLNSGNQDTPATGTAWSSTGSYFKGQVVTFANVAYQSLIDLNVGNEPDLAPALFNISTTYSTGNKVGASDGIIYTSVGSSNLGHDPTLDGGVHWTPGGLNPWTTVFVGGSGSLNWLEIGGVDFPGGVALTTLNIVYPIGTGPSTQSSTMNVFMLPASFLRPAPLNPKLPQAFLGGPSGVRYDDRTYENGYLCTSDGGPVTLRFVANITDVRAFDTMFCEGLAARIALEVVETLTQSGAKLQAIAGEYQKFMSEARLVNSIEDAWIDQPDDDYISVRY